MWLLDNSTPFSAERTWVRDRDGAEIWLVAVRGSFLIKPDGQQVLDDNQKAVSRVPTFSGEPGLSSLVDECDLVHTKTRTDVLVHGIAYSPTGKPVTSVDVRLKLASVDKTLRVKGDRRWERSISGVNLGPPEPFETMPIVYERAFGGTDQKAPDPREHDWESRNPVGTGFATRKEHLIDQRAPNVEDPRVPYQDWRHGLPAGFGPIARHWSPRVELAGTYDKQWESARKPLVPDDFDDRFYQCAPDGQQTNGFLKGGEVMELYNMTPGGYLRFQLPRVGFGLRTQFYDGSEVQHRAVLHTLIVYPHKGSFQLVWHSQLPCHHKVNKLKITDVSLKERINVSDSDISSGVWIPEGE